MSGARWSVLRRMCAGAALVLGVSACLDDPHGPGFVGSGVLAIQPVVPTAVGPAAFAIPITAFRLQARSRATGRVVYDSIVVFDVDSNAVAFRARIPMVTEFEDFQVLLDLLGEVGALYAGARVIVMQQGGASPQRVDSIPVRYVGPGSNIASIALVPGDTVLTWGDSLRYMVAARDAGGNPVPQFYISWSVTDPALGSINPLGQMRAPAARGQLFVRALVPNGVVDSVPLLFIPLPDRVVPVGPDQDTTVVGSTVALRVRVLGADGLGIRGIPVQFEAGPDGVVSVPLVVTDSMGLASVEARLGSVVGVYNFTARVTNAAHGVNESHAFRITGVPDRPAVMRVAQGNQQTGRVDEFLATPVQVQVLDAHGNPVAGQIVNFVVTSGHGSVFAGSNITSVNGVATERWRLGTNTTVEQRLEARWVDNETGEPILFATFRATPLPGPATALGKHAGDDQGGVVGAALDRSLAVVVTDAFGNAAPNATVTWSAASGSIVGAGPSDTEGIATAVWVLGTSAGLQTVSAALPTDVSVDFTAHAAPGPVTSVTVVVDADVLIALGATTTASASFRDAFDNAVAAAAVQWSSSDDAVVAVDSLGRVTAGSNGQAAVRATVGAAVDSVEVMVDQIPTAVAVSSPVHALTALGQAVQLRATPTDGNGFDVADAVVEWSSSDESIAMVDATGLVTAVANGHATISARADGRVSGSLDVEVQQVPASASVTPGDTTLTAVGASVRLVVTAADANGHPIARPSVTWVSGNTDVATVDDAGMVTAVGPGYVTITAQFIDGTTSDITLTIAVAVDVSPVLAGVRLGDTYVTLTALGATRVLEATPVDANEHPLLAGPIVWISSEPGVAAVSVDGLVTAVGNGRTTITASVGGFSAEATVDVRQVAASLAVTPTSLVLAEIGARTQLALRARDANNNDIVEFVTLWSSADPTVASVSESGLVTALAPGETVVSAAVQGLTIDVSVRVHLEDPPIRVPTTITVEPDRVELSALGAQRQLIATVLDQFDDPMPSVIVEWLSLNTTVAMVSADGLVTAVAEGETVVTASAGGVEADADVVVRFDGESPIDIVIDLKPGSQINPLNPGARGRVPLAILTTSMGDGEPLTFDARDVDIATVRLAGASVDHWSFVDIDGDGDLDLLLHFRQQDITLASDATSIELVGRTLAGMAFRGTDVVTIAPG